MRILIATGIYPPKISGPAQYAQNMHTIWSKMGHSVSVKTFILENFLPTGLRHLWYFFKILPYVFRADIVFALDTFSVGLPAVLACRLLNKKVVIRTGGDFLWEGYVERTGDMVLLRDFYETKIDQLNSKEKTIFRLTKWVLRNASLLVFSTEWQKDIFFNPYALNSIKTTIIENHYEKVNSDQYNNPTNKKFIAGTRPLKWKNTSFLKSIFDSTSIKESGAVLDMNLASREEFMEKIRNSYAVALVSLGDISPHMILDAINLGKPFILTEENGLMNRVKDIALTVDPKNADDIKEKILWLMDENNYENQEEKIKNFSFVRTWDDIAKEYIELFKQI